MWWDAWWLKQHTLSIYSHADASSNISISRSTLKPSAFISYFTATRYINFLIITSDGVKDTYGKAKAKVKNI